MLNVRIICVGKFKEKYWEAASAEYMKRLGAYCSISVEEIKEERLPANPSRTDEQNVIEAEGRAILAKISKTGREGAGNKSSSKGGSIGANRSSGKGNNKSANKGGGGRDSFVVALDIGGRELGSEELAKKIRDISFTHSSIDFIIGGSLGLSEEVKSRADLKLSFGRITLPHQLARIVLLEQIYRAFKINAGEAYHK